MGNTATSIKRQCRSLWKVSLSHDEDASRRQHERDTLTEEEIDTRDRERARQDLLDKLEGDIMRRRELAEYELEEARDTVHDAVTLELQELRRTLGDLSEDLRQPVQRITADQTEDHKRPFTKLDDYVHETMYPLLMWLAGQPEYQPLKMGQLLFFLKSPHIKQRQKYVLKVERILRSLGLSVFEPDLVVEASELARSFNILNKRIAQATITELDQLETVKHRATWHALQDST